MPLRRIQRHTPQRSESPFVAGLVLAAGGSSRLGRPKQLLPYGDGTLLGHVLGIARTCPFDQLLVAIGGSSDEVRAAVDLNGCTVVENPSFGEGCASSIAVSLLELDKRVDVLVLMLGDQPGIARSSVELLLAGRGGKPVAVCHYADGRGHPFAFSKAVFRDLAALHGDKGVWKLIERRSFDVADVRVPGCVPLDVDTWDDYQAVLQSESL